MEPTEIKFLQSVKGCTRKEQRPNQEIRQELQSQYTRKYKQNWIQHLDRTETKRLQKHVELQTERKKTLRQTKDKMDQNFGTGYKT